MCMTQEKKRRTYLTKNSLDFVKASKLKTTQILNDGGWKQDLISRETGFPQASFSKKLNPNRTESLSLAEMCVLADFLGITVREMLPEPQWRSLDEERYNYMIDVMNMPIEHVKYLIKFYKEIKDILQN